MYSEKPVLNDHGITPKQYALYHSRRLFAGVDDPSKLTYFSAVAIIIPSVFFSAFAVTGNWIYATVWALLLSVSPIPGFLVTFLVALVLSAIIHELKRFWLLRSSVASQIRLYDDKAKIVRAIQYDESQKQRELERKRREDDKRREETAKAQRRKLRDYWADLKGPDFERELGVLYRQLGYLVQSTPTSGDEGVDLILRRDGKKIVVQCKGHKAPVGPAIARELYGSMVALRASKAILACTGGFTKGVREFAKNKPIELVSAPELVTMAHSVQLHLNYGEPVSANSPPNCPRCGREMRLRRGKYGSFWGCSTYPRCKRTRELWGKAED